MPARDVRALAREWGTKKTYLGAGGWGVGVGGACRGPMGVQWARMMAIIGAMQGYGRPGYNFGNLQFGAPLDFNFYFPGYAEGSFSGDLAYSANSANNYQRMPHIVTMSSVRQGIPRHVAPRGDRQRQGHRATSPTSSSVQGQFFPIALPVARPRARRDDLQVRQRVLRHDGRREPLGDHVPEPESLQFVVNQSVWKEGETTYADVILPACTVFERWDIGEWYNVGAGYVHHMFSMNNHRVISLQHKCIEPLGESKSDYDIFLAISEKLGMGSHVLGGRHHRARLVQARVRLLRHGQAHHLAQVPEEGLLRRAVGPGNRPGAHWRTAGSTRAARRTRPSPTRCRRTT